MHITDSQLSLGSTHALEQQIVRTSALERIRGTDEMHVLGGLFEQELNKMMAARPQDSELVAVPSYRHAQERLCDMLESMLAMLFGLPATSLSAALPGVNGDRGSTAALDHAAPAVVRPRPHWWIVQSEQVSESESCQFAASGKVCLADGSQRQFEVGFQLESSEEVSRTVSRTLTDPLVVDFSAPTVALATSGVAFDLDSDGTLEQMRVPGAGSALLFLDRNHNGRADNGSELFGPDTGNGFAELARLDSDHNGWIDGADPAFADLRLWQADGDSERVQRLDQAGIGALATAAANTPFAVKENGATVAQMRSSSVWLGETGGAGVIRQVDVVTTPIAADKT